MSSTGKKMFGDDVFVTIIDTENPMSMPLTENYVSFLRNDLEVGHYEGFVYDEDTDSDVEVNVYVSSHCAIVVEK